MEPIDFKSPEAETLVLSRLTCPPLGPCFASWCGSQADGVWDGTLLDEYALRAPDAVLLFRCGVCGAWQEGPNFPRFLALGNFGVFVF